jgi:hypothetical protein
VLEGLEADEQRDPGPDEVPQGALPGGPAAAGPEGSDAGPSPTMFVAVTVKV